MCSCMAICSLQRCVRVAAAPVAVAVLDVACITVDAASDVAAVRVLLHYVLL